MSTRENRSRPRKVGSHKGGSLPNRCNYPAALVSVLSAAGSILGMVSRAPVFGASSEAAQSVSLADLSIEQIVNLEVTTVSRKETKLNQSAAAVAVLTGEEVRQMGVTSLPEALRAVPGLDVAQFSSSNTSTITEIPRSFYTKLTWRF